MRSGILASLVFAVATAGLAGCGGEPVKRSAEGGTESGTPMSTRHLVLSPEEMSISGHMPDIIVMDRVALDQPDRFTPVMKVGDENRAAHDSTTGLTWEIEPAGATAFPWYGEIQPKHLLNWYRAQERCIRSRIGGRFGWRLPTLEELASLQVEEASGWLRLPTGHPFRLPDGMKWETTLFWTSTEFRNSLPGVNEGALASGALPSEIRPSRAWAIGFLNQSYPENVLKISDVMKRPELASKSDNPTVLMASWCVRED